MRGATTAALVLAWALATAATAAGPDPLGPAPRDEDGRFQNLDGPLVRAGPTVTLPFFARRIFGFLRAADGLPPRAAEPVEALARASSDGAPTATWIGHATLLFRHDGVSWLSDPQWSARAGPGGRLGARRFGEPGLAIEDVPPLDFVVVSHNHYDHLDLASLRALAARRPVPVFYVPLGNAELLREAGIGPVVELDWGQSARHDGVEVHCLPARHWSRRGLFDIDRALWSSWAVVGDRRRVYFGGDTGLFAELAGIGSALGPFDLAALPIGAYEPVAMMQPVHLNPEEAVVAAERLRAERTVGMHFGTFDLTDEPIGEPPVRFRAAARAAGWEDERAWLLALGETRPF